jgi:hypothetical protein
VTQVRREIGALSICLLVLAAPVAATPPLDTEVVYLRKDCSSFVDPSVCFETMAAATDWLWGSSGPRNPSAGDPVLVDIGPGDWDVFVCDASSASRGWVTLRGSGRETTRIVRNENAAAGAVEVTACDSLIFQDMTIHGNYAGVNWKGDGGSSTWTNTEIVATGFGSVSGAFGALSNLAWYDNHPSTTCAEIALHYFYSSKVVVRGGASFQTAYSAKCSEVWFYGGEITATHDADSELSMGSSVAVNVLKQGDVRVFGSAIRSNTGGADSTSFPSIDSGTPGIVGVIMNEGMFHMHGGIINASAEGSSEDNDVSALWVFSGATMAHTPGTAFIAKGSGTGSSWRVRGTASKIQAPFLWQSGPKPPGSTTEDNVVLSADGQDMFVETDCGGSGGSCASGGSEAHLMIYNPARCTDPDSPWFDVMTGACRVP